MAITDKIAAITPHVHALDRLDDDARRLTLEAVAARYYERLVRFFNRRIGSHDEAADLAQDAFLKLSAIEMDRVREPGPFLFATARNLLKDRARAKSTRDATLSVAMDMTVLACPKPQPEQTLDGKEQLAVLDAALRDLSPKCRAVLVLYRFDELSHGAIADQLGISVSMVEKYLKRALNHCRRALEEANGGLSPIRKTRI